MSLPPLPPSHQPWSAAIRNAYQQLNHAYQTAFSYVASESLEAHRLQQYGNTIITDAYPILLLVAQSAESESLPEEWIENVADDFQSLLALIKDRWTSAKEE
jgi:uncharacterized membrane protein YjdF